LKYRDTSNPLPNDGGIGGVVGEPHYDLWKNNFGRIAEGSGGGQGNGAVPEPATAFGVLLAACALVLSWRLR
jgi:hypothetical protein